jgi:GDP-4-dehydro-6-deoxy-D-mannose reductase
VPGPTLVTGAAGFAGSHLVELLAGKGDLVAWDHTPGRPELADRARWERVDLLNRDQVRRAVRDLRPAAVYHCAGAAHVAHSWQNTPGTLATNVLATHYLLDALRRAGDHCRVLIPGSATVYASSSSALTETSATAPRSPYALSKLAQEQLGLRTVDEDGVDVVVARSFNHTGPRQSPDFFAPGVARQIALIERSAVEPVIKVGNLDAARDLLDVRDVVRAYALLMERGEPGLVYNVASGNAHSMRSVLDGLLARSRRAMRVETEAARLRPHDIPVFFGDPTRLKTTTGWSAEISFDRMLDDLLGYWRSAI